MQASRIPLPRTRSVRGGLSLLEIIVALAVLTGSAAILAQLVDLGSHHAERSAEITAAQTVAHNLLNELLAGVRPWEDSEAFQPVDIWSRWDYQLRLHPLGLGRLTAATITVVERPQAAVGSTAAPAEELAQLDPILGRRTYRLTRWIRQQHATELGEDGVDLSSSPLSPLS